MLLSHDQVLAELDTLESRTKARIRDLKANLHEAEKSLEEIKTHRSLVASYKLLHDHLASQIQEVQPPASETPLILSAEESENRVQELESEDRERIEEAASIAPSEAPSEATTEQPANFLKLLQATPSS